MNQHRDMRGAVMTAQHREFSTMTDGDVESALKQLDALGLLTDELDPKP